MNEQNEIRGDEREDAFENAPEQSELTEKELDEQEAMQNPGGDPWRLEW